MLSSSYNYGGRGGRDGVDELRLLGMTEAAMHLRFLMVQLQADKWKT